MKLQKFLPWPRVGLFLLVLCNFSLAQSSLWYLTRGGPSDDEAWGADVDSAGNIYFAACEKSPPLYWYFDINLYKFDPNGWQIWKSQPWGGAFLDYAYITVVKAPYVYVAGRADTCVSLSGSCANMLVLAYNMNDGGLVWEYKWDQGYGYEEVDGLAVGSDGIYISGWTQGATTQFDIVVQKLSFDGKLVWSQTWGTNGWDAANGQLALDEDAIYIAGHYNGMSYGFGGDALLIAFSRNDGHYLWHTTWGGSDTDDAYGMTASVDSFLYVVGPTASYGNGLQMFLNKYRKTGQLVWSTLWGGADDENSRALAADGDSAIYVAGNTKSYGAGGADIVLIKFDPTGSAVSHKTWGGPGDDFASGIAAHDEHLYIAGRSDRSGAGNRDALLLKMNGRTMQFPDTPVSVKEIPRDTPTSFSLEQSYPNPFNSATTVTYSLPQNTYVVLKVYNLLGQEMATLVDKEMPAGTHSVVWNAQDAPSGVYLYKITAGNYSKTSKMVLLK